MSTLNTNIHEKHVSEYKGSPCIKCLVKMTCQKSLLNNSACQDYVDFILCKIREINIKQGRINENKK